MKTLATCPSCGLDKPLSAYKRLQDGPPVRLLDFCNDCVQDHGLTYLYSTFTEGVDDDVRRYMLDNRQAPKLDRAKREEVRLEAEAKKEFARRELCRQLMMPFVLRFFTAYKPGWVHQDICRRLEKFVRDVEEQRSPRLIMTLPPRHGKSTLLSDMFPSWVLGKHPEWEFIATSYAVTLPIKFSRAIRDRLRDPAYAGVFPECSLRADAQGIEEWRLTAGGGYRAAGVGGGITGMGAHCLIVDDPIKDWAEAQSETIREGAKSWFNTAAYNRLAPGGGVIIVQTRWHDDDLAGYVLSQMQEQIEAGLAPEDIDNWELVNYPAIATGDEYLMPDSSIEVDPLDTPSGARLLRRKGEALHPERYDLAKLMRIKNRYTPQEWAALYQQDPVPDDGAFFGKDMFRHYAYLPGTRDEYTYVTAWDVAIGEDRRNDWTVGVVCAINERGDMYVIDMVRGRYGTQELVQLAVGMIERYDCQVFGMEHGQIKMTLWPLIVDEMRRRRLTCNIADLKPIKDKETRATPLRGMMQRGVVMFPMQNQRPWVERMVGEMLRFPAGKHDDIVDALAWAAFMYRTAPRPLTSTTLKKQHVKSFRDELDQFPGALGTSDSETSYMAY